MGSFNDPIFCIASYFRFFWLYKDAVEKQNGCDAKFGVILRCIRRGVAILISSLKSDDDGKCMKLTTMYVTWQDYCSTMSKTNRQTHTQTNKQTNRYTVKELWKALSCNYTCKGKMLCKIILKMIRTFFIYFCKLGRSKCLQNMIYHN